MLKIITKSDFIPDLSKSIHYVSWTPINNLSVTGYSRMAWVDAIIRIYLPDLEIEKFYRTIDKKNETGTLYPKANITIMPCGKFTDEEIYRHFNDTLMAQNQFIKARHLVFDMRNYSYYDSHLDCYDDSEYMYMIDYNTWLKSDFDIYIIASEEKFLKTINNSFLTISYKYSSEEEIAELELNRQHK